LSLLLDSNALLWWLTNDPRLDRLGVRNAIQAEPDVIVSVISPWELWIKAATGKLRTPDDMAEQIARSHFTLIAPTLEDARLAAALPPLHRDPFDRMIVAQALNRQATVVTGDRRLAAYGVDAILV